MSLSPRARAVQLAARYLAPHARWTLADDERARALREDPEARRAWAIAIATHRALVGAPDGLPSGIEQRRQADLAIALSGTVRAPSSTGLGWLRWAVPMVAAGIAAGVMTALPRPMPPAEEWIRARGLHELEMPAPRVGLGVGGVTEGGQEYEAVSSHAVHLEDWLRFSYTNERPELTWLYVFALQSVDGAATVRPIAPLPDETQSLAIGPGHFVQLPFETRLAARHSAGPVRIVALFTAAPLTVAHVEQGLAGLASSAIVALPSELEARLRERLQLPPGGVVQILDTVIVPGTAAPTPPMPGPRQETP